MPSPFQNVWGRCVGLPVLASVLLLASCGYPGEPRPPALNRPVPVQDLTAVEHANKIIVRFTIPTETTEDLILKNPPEMEVRIGPPPPGKFDFSAWEKISDRVTSTPAGTAEIDVAKYNGKTEIIGVRAHGPHGQDAGWSRLVLLTVVQPLEAPAALEAKNSPDAVRLDWHAAAPEFRIFRDGKQVGTSDKPFYLDPETEPGKTYRYSVQAIEKSGENYAESDISSPISFKPTDTFPPAVPAGVTAVPGTRTIELVWERNTEKDFASYRVYRDGGKVADALTAPAFSDKDVKAGVKYTYEISAVDTSGNESAHSRPVEALIP